MTIELPEELGVALKQHTAVRGISPDVYVREMLQRDLGTAPETPVRPFKNSYGILAKYGSAPTAEEIDENRVDMLRNSIFATDAE
jgi:hypothetical protein